MKNIPLPSLFLLVVALGLGHAAWAEKADRNKPMNIEADALRYDDLKQVSVFSGGVSLTKGSIHIRGAMLETRQDPQGAQFATVTGTADAPAFFRQKRDGVDEFIEGEGEVIEYDGRADTVKFIRKAQLRRFRGAALADEITGALIVYDNLAGTFSVDGSAATAAVGTSGARPGRVRATLTPKAEAAITTAPPSTPPAALRPTTTLEGAAK